MPTYTYKREDDTVFEIVQRITAAALTHCPDTGLKCKRIIVTANPVEWKCEYNGTKFSEWAI